LCQRNHGVGEQIKKARSEKDTVVRSQNFEKAAVLRDQEKRLLAELEDAKTRWNEDEESSFAEATIEDVSEVVSMMTGIR
jgi:ATP-dependent Clp protease ATP-binding subunit ClpC